MKKASNKRALITASIAGLVAASSLAFTSPAQAASTGELEHCYGINKCKGTGACGGKGHSCAGKNACGGQGYVDVAKGSCLKIKDGRLTA